MTESRSWAITAVGGDRPGIVAAVTKVFYELGCNLADCSMTRLSGQFAMILLIRAPHDITETRLQHALDAPADQFGLAISVVEAPPAPPFASERPYVISLYGSDHPGIVFRVAENLAGRQINVTNLVSRIVGNNIYAVVLEIDLPEGAEAEALEADLNDLALDLKVDLTLRPALSAEL